MINQTAPNTLVSVNLDARSALRNAVRLWASSVTSASSEQHKELLRYKQRVVAAFFGFVNDKSLADITPQDVEVWRDELSKSLKPATVYARVCFLSSFFNWAMRDPQLKTFITSNPARLALPKAPKAYQTESVKSWTDEELQRIVEVVKAKADGEDAGKPDEIRKVKTTGFKKSKVSGKSKTGKDDDAKANHLTQDAASKIVGKRDYALLLFFLVTGMRRQEVISLRGGQLKISDDDAIVITGKVKGGDYVGREVRDPLLKAAMLDYLAASKRSDALKSDAPLWTRHDRAGKSGAPLTSHAFAKNLKRYAEAAGVEGAHIHQTRHSFARIVAEDTGSITDVQDALGHRNAATTRVYVQRISVKKDKHSASVMNRLSRKTS